MRFVKHAAPDIDPACPASSWSLSEAGRLTAARLGPVFNDRDAFIGPVVSSPEPKARETAEILAVSLGCAVTVDPDLHEHRRETVGFLDADVFRNGVRQMFEHPNVVVFGEEAATAAADRFSRAVERVVCAHGSDALVVAHGTVISLFSARVCQLTDPMALWTRLTLPSVVDIDLKAHQLRSVGTVAPITLDYRPFGREVVSSGAAAAVLEHQAAVASATTARERTAALGRLAEGLRLTRHLSRAREALAEARTLAERGAFVKHLAVNLLRDAIVLQYQGEHRQAVPLFRAALEAMENAGILPSHGHFAHQHLGKCLVERGDIHLGLVSLNEALRLREQMNDEALIASTRWALAAAESRVR